MKLLLIVEIPGDDGIQHQRVERALQYYAIRIRKNNRSIFGAPPPIGSIGLTAGPNVLDFSTDTAWDLATEMRGVRITEQRIDADCFKFRIWNWLRRWPRVQHLYSAIAFRQTTA